MKNAVEYFVIIEQPTVRRILYLDRTRSPNILILRRVTPTIAQHVSPLRANRAATAPTYRVCSANRENRVGNLACGHDKTQAHSNNKQQYEYIPRCAYHTSCRTYLVLYKPLTIGRHQQDTPVRKLPKHDARHSPATPSPVVGYRVLLAAVWPLLCKVEQCSTPFNAVWPAGSDERPESKTA